MCIYIHIYIYIYIYIYQYLYITFQLIQNLPNDLQSLARLRISRMCSYEENFVKHKANMKPLFLKRKYPEKLISAEMNKVRFSNIERTSNGKIQKGMPLVGHTIHCLSHPVASLIMIFIYYKCIKKFRGYLLHNRWFLIGVRVRAVISLGLNWIW